MALSPMMIQYMDIKNQYNDYIIFFRLGDFYEMFYEDAVLASSILELTLTGRDCGLPQKAPMCGVPYHSCEPYIAKLVDRGYPVAICEQIGNPKAPGIVKREVIRVITPGTAVESLLLDETKNNYICSGCFKDDRCGFSFCDVTTGTLSSVMIDGDDFTAKSISELLKYSPKEMIVNDEFYDNDDLRIAIEEGLGIKLCKLEKSVSLKDAEKLIISKYTDDTLMTLNLLDKPLLSISIANLFNYLKKIQFRVLSRISRPEIYKKSKYLHMDANTLRNLEIVETMRSRERKGSLLWVLDKTKTSMGKRLLRCWLERPLYDYDEILNRQNGVTEIFSDIVFRDELINSLNGIFDIERLFTRIVCRTANPKEIRVFCEALKKIPNVKSKLLPANSEILKDVYNNIDILDDICDTIDRTLVDDPPVNLRDGGVIKNGFSEELDSIIYDMTESNEILTKLIEREKANTGIQKLKIGFNKVFGYYIEVLNSQKSLVPIYYERRQTLSNCERYITSELKEIETRILGAKDKFIELEQKIFYEMIDKISLAGDRITKTSQALATLDVLCSLAFVAGENEYCCPKITQSGEIKISNGRHPVVEELRSDFIHNDLYMNEKSDRTIIITGPNMSGKSTFMRQNALMLIMAQIGSYVPAESAEICLVDAVFTRVGASDDLTTGQSTFMVEMNEVAVILRNATKNSFLILDEIGRGTSTFDGMSIARAVLEYVTNLKKIGAKTLFSTHYHELSVLEKEMKGIKNYNVAVLNEKEDIVFLRKIVPGSASQSYGVEVAKLAGIPDEVIKRAKVILAELEQKNPKKKNGTEKSYDFYIGPKEVYDRHFGTEEKINEASEESALSLDEQKKIAQITEKIKSVDLTQTTPLQALNLLYELKNIID